MSNLKDVSLVNDTTVQLYSWIIFQGSVTFISNHLKMEMTKQKSIRLLKHTHVDMVLKFDIIIATMDACLKNGWIIALSRVRPLVIVQPMHIYRMANLNNVLAIFRRLHVKISCIRFLRGHHLQTYIFGHIPSVIQTISSIHSQIRTIACHLSTDLLLLAILQTYVFITHLGAQYLLSPTNLKTETLFQNCCLVQEWAFT